MYSEQDKPRLDMQNNGVVNLPYRISPCFIYHLFFPFQNVVIFRSALFSLKSALQITCQAGSGGWDGGSRIPRQPLTAPQLISVSISLGLKVSLGGQIALSHFQKCLILSVLPFFSNDVR